MNRLLLLISLIFCSVSLTAQTTDDALRQFEGHYIFHGTDPTCEAPDLVPCYYYECDIQAINDHLQLTGFIGEVDSNEHSCYVGTYNPDNATIHFVCGGNEDGESVYDFDGYRYFLYDFTVNVGSDAEGHLTLTRPGYFMFYAEKKGNWPRASYSSLTFTKDAILPVWNSNIKLPTSPTSIEDLLCYTIEFENAHSIAASGHDVMGLIYSPDGELYAMALVNGIVDVFGTMRIRESRATINFVRLADLTTTQQAAATASAGRTVPACHTPGYATVIFKAKSFKVDGQLINYDIVHEYKL